MSESQADIAAAYSSLTHNRERELSDKTNPQWRYVLRNLPADKGARILDAGCGSGRFGIQLQRAGWCAVSAVDLLDSIAEESIDYQQAGIEDLPFADGEFDLVYSNSVVHYVEDVDAAIAELSRVLKPGGTLVFSCHTRKSIPSLRRRFLRRYRTDRYPHLQHLNFRDANQYTNAAVSAGLSVTAVDGWGLVPLSRTYAVPLANEIERRWGIQVPVAAAPSRTPIMRWAQAHWGYHLIIEASKPAGRY